MLLLRRLATVESLLGHSDMSLALLNLAGSIDDSDLATKVDQAQQLLELRYFHGAVELLTNVAEDEQDFQAREGLAEVYQAMGMSALALDAYGEGWPPWSRQRWARWRLWWRSGGPFRLIRRRRRKQEEAMLRDWPADEPVPPSPPADIEKLLSSVAVLVNEDRRVFALLEHTHRLIETEELAVAAALLRDDLEANGPSAALLCRLAWVMHLQGQDSAALSHLDEARRLNPRDLETVQNLVGILISLKRFRDALAVVDGMPPPDRKHPDVRVAVGEIYRAMGLPALSLHAYGDPWTLPSWHRKGRHRYWWRSGGPLRLLLWRPRRLEEGVLRKWRGYTQHLRVLDTLPWPAQFDPTEIGARLDWHIQRSVLIVERSEAIKRWAGRAALLGGGLVAWLSLSLVARRAWPHSLAWAAVMGFIGTLVSFGALLIVFFRFANATTWYGVLMRGAPTGLVILSSGYAVTRLPPPAPAWFDVVGGLLAATAGLALCYFVAVTPSAIWQTVGLRRLWRRGPREDILDELLDILDGLAHPTRRNELDWRSAWMSRLERAAVTLERRLPAALRPSDPVTAAWSAERARGAAAAVRLLKRQITAPVEGSWDRLTAILRDEVVVIATGDLGKLRWTAPPSPAAVRRSRWRTAVVVLRSIALAAAPLAVVFAIQPVLGLEAQMLQWAKVTGLAWAVLYLLLAVDPTVREKIEAAQAVGSLFGATGPDPGRPERREPHQAR
ncbi:hypothetical protein DKT68_05590 [Micromonospora acroterricola]|uniref:Tetratricopeptide repeat-containing protein n=1 Tax=Micromonospora acroterricola TaxID=2202421 RepID=A0A317DBN0_9ACTN|nr:hypothetical protein DKT68_05590 [Micromonospora acroterricola]